MLCLLFLLLHLYFRFRFFFDVFDFVKETSQANSITKKKTKNEQTKEPMQKNV